MNSISPSELMSRKIGLSWTIAHFLEDFDPYDFRDNLDNGETVDQGITRCASEMFSALKDCRYDHLIDLFSNYGDEDGNTPETMEAHRFIMRELKELKKLDGKLISKNLLKIKRRR